MTDMKRTGMPGLPRFNSIVTVENLSKSSEAFFMKTNKKGRLFKGPNWTAYNKSSLGSIPIKVEKNIIEDSKVHNKLAFTTQSERFVNFQNKTSIRNPGPGSYELRKDFDSTRSSISFHSSKGFGNGFVSSSDRFDNPSLYYGKYLPGPGEYNAHTRSSITNYILKPSLGYPLYTKKQTKSLGVKRSTPGPGYYNPIFASIPVDGDNTRSSFFTSKIPRFKHNDKKKVPGPGKYFQDISNTNNIQNPHSQSYFFKVNEDKPIDPLQKLDIKINQTKEDAKYRLIEKKGKVIGYVPLNYNETISDKDGQRFAMTTKELFRLKNKPIHNALNELKEQEKTISSLQLRNEGSKKDKEVQEYEYIHRLLYREPKADLFELSPARWPAKANQFKPPGPAYYKPRTPNTKFSFNKNNSDFIVPSGVVNPSDIINEEFY